MKSARPLRRWMALQFALVACVPLVVVAALVWLLLLPQMRTDIAVHHQALARAIAGRVTTHLLDAELDLHGAADYMATRGDRPASHWFDLLDAHAGKGEIFEAIYVVDAQGAVQSVGLPRSRRNRREDLLGLDLSRREFFRQARSRKQKVWSETFLSTVSSRLAVALAIPEGDRTIIGEITIDRLCELVRDLPVESGLLTLIMDGRDQIIADSQQGPSSGQLLWNLQPIMNDPSWKGLPAAGFEINGERFIGTVVAVEQIGWKVLVAQRYRDGFRQIAWTLRLVGAGLVVSLILAAVAGWLQSRGFSRHFERYTEQARAIADGDYEQPRADSIIREFVDLAAALQRMAHAIREREGDLRASEAKYRTLFETMVQGVVYVDAEGRIGSANPAAEAILGLSLDRMRGSTLSDLPWRAIGEDDSPFSEEAMPVAVALRAGQEVRNVVMGLFHPGGAVFRWVNVNAIPQFRPDRDRPYQVYATFEDITERKRAEAALRLSEDNLAITLNSIGDAVIATDVDGTITRMNPVAEELTGWRFDEAAGMPLDEVFHIVNAHSRLPVESPAAKVLARGQIVGLANHTVLISRDGSERQIADSGAPIRRPAGQILGVVLVFRDVTEAYEQARKVRESERLLKSVTTNFPGVLYRFHSGTGREYGNTFVSEKTSDIFGLDVPSEQFAAAFIECIPREERDDFLASIAQAVQEVAPWHYEGRFNKPSGETIWFFGSSVPHKDGDEIVFDGLLMDITDRKQTETELRRLRNYLANIIDSMPSVLVGVDGAGHVTQWNRRAEKATGRNAAAVLGKPLEAVYPSLSARLTRIRETMRSGSLYTEQKVERREDGEILYEDFTVYPLVTNGVEGAVIRVDDVTERVRLEEMMIQSEKMLSVGGLAAGMAHEINNPLAGILQNVMVLENRLSADLEANHRAAAEAGTSLEAIRAYLEKRALINVLNNIRDSGKRAAKIVRNMLEFARKSDRVFSRHDPGEVLDQTVELAANDYDLKKSYDFKQIRIVREYAYELPKVPCEKSKIQQVILNILKNGAEAMSSQGTCDGAPPRFILRTRLDGSMVRMEIEDNGPGMDEATRKRAFEPFFTTKPVNRGTGLGLSVSYFIVTEDHHGTLEVSSSKNGGSTFVIRLPLEGGALS